MNQSFNFHKIIKVEIDTQKLSTCTVLTITLTDNDSIKTELNIFKDDI